MNISIKKRLCTVHKLCMLQSYKVTEKNSMSKTFYATPFAMP